MNNLQLLKGGAAATSETVFCDTEEVCTYSAFPNCPLTSSKATRSKSRRGDK